MAAPILRCLCARPVRFTLGSVRIHTGFLHRNLGTEFKSAYSLDKIYPSSCFDYGRSAADYSRDCSLQNSTDIPLDRLTVTYSRSSGPGGQHVNKVNTKAEIRFHVQTADWIPEDVRQKIILKNKNRINKSGELIVTSEASRYQMRNLADCLQKIGDIIAEASLKPKEPSEEDKALRKTRLEKMQQDRLKQKKMHSDLKQSRRVGLD
ncbi:large ribosomal subunit protein mL62 isoform X2 [Lepisosteus oculatus]|uniref:Large ribosomal subunit protein mL62 n=1 Tax=Lepisosteus oculatus TaxID=7918 RepID=W5N0E2_LEPOC|nr:PREDICTED: peptidyl-tRNA hydrolase ICT1, mitochondrial isoform X2 [Lepisosteus oculatus]